VLAQRETQQSERVVRKVKRQLPLVVRIGVGLAPIASVLVGLVLVGNAALPLAWYYVHPDVAEANLVTPLTEVVETARDEPIVQSAAPTPASELPQEPTVIAEELSYTNLTHWFAGDVLPAQPMAALPGAQVLTEYMLTIPKLNISQAKVKIGSVDLSKSLVQYSGTANPGDPGAPVIFGHSVLRQFYNPSEKNTRRYYSIFSTIMTLKKNDEVFLTANGVRYRYLVQEKLEVKPEDTFILQQEYNQRLLKLVTCVPEGTYLRRGVVVAKLAEKQE
jgi:LPXTG-site transpeptidase (sortase) family protein